MGTTSATTTTTVVTTTTTVSTTTQTTTAPTTTTTTTVTETTSVTGEFLPTSSSPRSTVRNMDGSKIIFSDDANSRNKELEKRVYAGRFPSSTTRRTVPRREQMLPVADAWTATMAPPARKGAIR